MTNEIAFAGGSTTKGEPIVRIEIGEFHSEMSAEAALEIAYALLMTCHRSQSTAGLIRGMRRLGIDEDEIERIVMSAEYTSVGTVETYAEETIGRAMEGEGIDEAR